MTPQEERARRMIAGLSTKRLVEQWELTETNNDPNIPTVRGWLMDEMASRNPEAFGEWLDSTDESPRNYFL